MIFRIPPAPPAARRTQPEDPRRGALRAKLLAARFELADRDTRSRILCDRLLRWLRTMPLQRLAFYWPIKAEPDVNVRLTRLERLGGYCQQFIATHRDPDMFQAQQRAAGGMGRLPTYLTAQAQQSHPEPNSTEFPIRDVLS